MDNITVILLGAGLSRRMGARNKLLLPIRGMPMIRHMVAVYSEITDQPVLVVTGHEAKAIESALKGSSALTVYNSEFAQGQATSVVCGLRAAKPAGDVMIALGDQPFLTPSDLRNLLIAHHSADKARISIPIRDQQRGNPIIVPKALRVNLMENPKTPGCKFFTRAHPEHVQFHSLSSPAFYTDIDTSEDYDTLSIEKREANA